MSILDDTEWTDFKNLLQKHGYTESDFDVKEMGIAPGALEATPVRGSLTVTRRQNSVSRVYLIGHGSLWLNNFEDDLITHMFGAGTGR